MENQSNPFFIHPSDSPGIALVSQVLTDDNFSSWRRAMKMALIAKDKLGFIDGSIVVPPEEDPLHRSWIRNNNIVASWLHNSVCKEISVRIHSSNAATIWQELQEHFLQKNGPRIF